MAEVAGLRLSVSQTTLKHINSALLQQEWATLQGRTFPDKEGQDDRTSWKVRNIRITRLGDLETDLTLNDDMTLTWTGRTGQLRIEADWKAKKKVKEHFIRFHIDTSGDIEAKASSVDMAATLSVAFHHGNPELKLVSSSASLHGFDPKIGGDLIATIVGAIAKIFKNDIRHWLEAQLCSLIDKSLCRLTEDLKATEMVYDIKLAGVDVTLDNSFTDVTLTSQRLTTYHRAELKWRNTAATNPDEVQNWKRPCLSSPAFPDIVGDGVTIDIREDTLNTALHVLAANQALDKKFSFAKTEPKDREVFSGLSQSDCEGVNLWVFSFLFPQAADRFPGAHLGVKWRIEKAGVQVLQNKMSVSLTGHLTFTADQTDGSSEDMISGRFEFMVPYQVQFSENKLKTRPTGLGGRLIVENSLIGPISAQRLETTIRFIQVKMLNTMKDQATTEYTIKPPRGMTFKDSHVTLTPAFVRLESQVRYLEGDSSSSPGVWVGEDLGILANLIQVEDASAEG